MKNKRLWNERKKNNIEKHYKNKFKNENNIKMKLNSEM